MAQSVATLTWDWRDVLRWVRLRRRLIIMVAVSFMIGAAVYASTLPTLYAGRVVVALVPRETSDADSDDAVELTMPVYAARVQSPTTVREVARRLAVPADELADELTVTYEEESSTMTIETQMGSPSDAADAANALAATVVQGTEEDALVEGEIVSRALPEAEPDAPRRGMLALSALGAGIVVGMAASVFVESTNRKLRTTRDIARTIGLPVLGGIPRSRVFRKTPRRALSHPTVGSAFRSLRSSVLRSLPADGKTILAVTSPEPGAGKSVISALLAESIARVGRSVVLVDGDLYRPTLARKFQLDVHRSLAAALRGTISVHSAMKQGWVDGLWVLTTKSDKEAGDLVASRLPTVLREALEHVDIAIVDTPPLTGSAEGASISAMADAVLLVIRTGTTEDPLFDALNSIDTLKTPVIGVVANWLPEDLEADYEFG